jgi:hypothetical protein
MEDITLLLQKGALIAQKPSDFEMIPELSEEDKEIIRRETTREAAMLKYLRATRFLTSLQINGLSPETCTSQSSFAPLQQQSSKFSNIKCKRSTYIASRGWDQTGSNGANLSFPDEFDISTTDPDPNKAANNQWIVGMINAA